MFRNLAGNLVLHDRIETTDAKAKELRRVVERLITRALRLGDDLTVDVAKLKEADRGRVLARRLHAQRGVAGFLPRYLSKTVKDKDGAVEIEQIDLIYKLFNEIAPKYAERVKAGKGGGYTRITKKTNRRGDNAPVSIIELI
jgi:large subunit ribosomal protein L17